MAKMTVLENVMAGAHVHGKQKLLFSNATNRFS